MIPTISCTINAMDATGAVTTEATSGLPGVQMPRGKANPDRDKWDHVPWHERLDCTKCPRRFWGEKAWNEHYPCTDSIWKEEPGEFFLSTRKGKPSVMYFQYTDGVFVLLEEKAEFIKMQERARTARGGKADES